MVPIIPFLWHLLFLVFYAILLQQRFWPANVTKLLKFHQVPQTREVGFAGKAWCSAWPLHSFSQKHVLSLQYSRRSAEGWRSKSFIVAHELFFLNVLPHSPQMHFRCPLLQEALLSFISVWITYATAIPNSSSQIAPSTVIHNITPRPLHACLHLWSLSPQHLWLPHKKHSDLWLTDRIKGWRNNSCSQRSHKS